MEQAEGSLSSDQWCRRIDDEISDHRGETGDQSPVDVMSQGVGQTPIHLVEGGPIDQLSQGGQVKVSCPHAVDATHVLWIAKAIIH